MGFSHGKNPLPNEAELPGGGHALIRTQPVMAW